MIVKNQPIVTIAQRLKHELWEYALLSASLFVCFGALILYKTAIAGAEGSSYAKLGIKDDQKPSM